jgi:hypothetical protein
MWNVNLVFQLPFLPEKGSTVSTGSVVWFWEVSRVQKASKEKCSSNARLILLTVDILTTSSNKCEGVSNFVMKSVCSCVLVLAVTVFFNLRFSRLWVQCTIFSDVTPCSKVEDRRRFGGTYCPYLVDGRVSQLKISSFYGKIHSERELTAFKFYVYHSSIILVSLIA